MFATSKSKTIVFIIRVGCLLLISSQIGWGPTFLHGQENGEPLVQVAAPQLVPSSSYISLDGLSLIVTFDKPVNLSDSLEALERRKLVLSEPGEEISTSSHNFPQHTSNEANVCQSTASIQHQDRQQHKQLIQGILLCAKLLTRKTLKSLHKYRLHNCAWSSQLQFIITLAKPASGPLKVSFQQSTLTGLPSELTPNLPEEIGIQLSRLPLESLGIPLSPRLALTGPNQVPLCGQFTLSAHLFSPFGTWPGESVSLAWSVERLSGNLLQVQAVSNSSGSQLDQSSPSDPLGAQQIAQQQLQAAENAKWQRLQELVSANRANNLVLDAQLLQLSPQQYLFQVSATFTTSLTTISLNASHKLSKLDYETPIGSLFGTHLLSQLPHLNTNRDLLLLADIRIPDCASDIKQAGMYWQVSDSRVRFEQTYAPFYLAKARSLPEQASFEFRLNLFYGIRVKRYSSASVQLVTGDPLLEASISNGLVAMSLGLKQNTPEAHWSSSNQQQQGQQLELFASLEPQERDKFSYQWSCFDGKSGQSCSRRDSKILATGVSGNQSRELSPDSTRNPLIERQKETQPILRLPVEWLESSSQLWFGLQKFDRHHSNGHQSISEYALVQTRPDSAGELSIGPILIGHHRTPLSVRNPLTGAMLLPSGVPLVLVGKVSGPLEAIRSISWQSTDYPYQLEWTRRNSTNLLTGRPELITELHLNPELLVANAHYHFQLSACLNSGSTGSVSLRLDLVSGINQCRVEASQSKQSSSLLVSVDFCNIPLDLSPISYQLYATETGEPLALGSSSENKQQSEYLNEQDEHQLAGQMKPLTIPQLTPSFHLSSSMALALLASNPSSPPGLDPAEQDELQAHQRQRVVVRFGARACDRLQACRMFYSEPFALEPTTITSATQNPSTSSARENQTAPNLDVRRQRLIELHESQTRLVQSIRVLIETARRQNLAGNSISAISLLSSAVDLGQKLLSSGSLSNSESSTLQPTATGNQQQEHARRATRNNNNSNNNNSNKNRQLDMLTMSSVFSFEQVRDLLQVALRDSLHYCAISLSRPIHYTDSGQANVVTESLANILSLSEPIVNAAHEFEIKFKAATLLARVTRKTIAEQVNLKLTSCVANFKSLQVGYGSLFQAFDNQYHLVEATSDSSHGGNHNQKAANSSLSSQTVNQQWFKSLSLNSFLVSSANHRSGGFNTAASDRQTPANYLSTTSTSTTSGITRKKRDETILAYLKGLRLAYRSLLSASAIQLPLGQQQILRYATRGSNVTDRDFNPSSTIDDTTPTDSSDRLIRSGPARHVAREPPRLATSASENLLAKSQSQKRDQQQPTFAAPADIVSSIRHLNGIPAEPIDIDLQQFGFVSIRFSPRFVLRFTQQIDSANIRCRNDTIGSPSLAAALGLASSPSAASTTSSATTAGKDKGNIGCATFVLALSSFAGKAPFRALDQELALRLPVIEISLLSPVDGSDLVQLMSSSLMNDLEVQVTYSPPGPIQSLEARKAYKCYRFDEAQNEWQLERRDTNNEIENQVSCNFAGLGAFSAFQGQPPVKESPLSLFIIAGLGVTLALVFILSVFSCFASDWKSSSDSQISNRSDDEPPSDLTIRQHHRVRSTHDNDQYARSRDPTVYRAAKKPYDDKMKR